MSLTDKVVSIQKVRKLTLFAALPAQALLGQFDAGSIAEPHDKQKLLDTWQEANQAYRRLGGPQRSFVSPDDVRLMEGVPAEHISELLERARKYPPYDTCPTEMRMVRIAKLVTPQLAVSVDRATTRAPLQAKLAAAELVDRAFGAGGSASSVTRQIIGITPTGGSLLYTSFDEDVRLHSPPRYRPLPISKLDDESPSLENVCFAIGGGLPFMFAFRIQIGPGITRLILGNGIHRAYRLANAGYEWCPLLVTDLNPMALPDPFADLPRALLLDPGVNPPLISDFTNPELTIPLDYHAVLKTVRFNWSIEQYGTVLK